MSISILLRGHLFRKCSKETQIDLYKKMISHVIKPLKKESKDINVIIVSYKDENSVSFIGEIFKDYNYFYFKIPSKKSQVVCFVDALNVVLENKLLENCEGLLILRSDLYFLQDIDYQRIDRNKILFQWNLLHQKSNGEAPDQIQFIGGNLIEEFIKKTKEFRIDTIWKSSLHNLYNFCVCHFGKEKISYLNYIADPEPNKDKCIIRGNPRPRYGIGNPLYNYSRYINR